MLARVVEVIPCWIRGSDALPGDPDIFVIVCCRIMCDYDRIKPTGSEENEFSV
jgi:hypothetical protein